MSPLSLRLRELRTAKGWTQTRLAEEAGVTRATVNRLENGRPASIDFAVLEKLAAAFAVDPGYLIVKNAEQPPKRGSSSR